MQITILGKRWNLRFTGRLHHAWRGECEPPDSPRKEIRVRSTLEGRERLEVVLHEVLHAADWTKDENWIEEFADDLAKILWKLGYRPQ